MTTASRDRVLGPLPTAPAASSGSVRWGASATRLGTPLGRTECRIRSLHFGPVLAVRDTHLPLERNRITALVGPSGCGKTTVLRCFNRTNDFVPGFRLEGSVEYGGVNIYAKGIDPVAVRRKVGMVFQRAHPFAMSIYDNVAFGLRINGYDGDHRERVEQALRAAALWDEVKNQLNASGLSLSGGQQQRLCIARAIVVEPALLLMDEPTSGLDPVTAAHIEELMVELARDRTLAIVTHDLLQAQRVADYTAFFHVDNSHGFRTGYLVEYGPTRSVFGAPREELTRQYIARSSADAATRNGASCSTPA